MALERFTNKEEILETNGVVKGIVWKEEDQTLLKLDVDNITPADTPSVELHAYTPSSDYIVGGLTDQFKVKSDKLFVDYYAALNEFELTRGLFEVVVNVHKTLLGTPENSEFYIKEISPDRREVAIAANLPEGVDKDAQAESIKDYLEKFGRDSYIDIIYDDAGNETGTVERPSSDDIAINLGGNKVYKIINQKEWGEPNEFVIRLYDKLPATINEKMSLWFVEELADSFVDNVDINVLPTPAPVNIMAGPNWSVDSGYNTITETDFKTWNDLLGSHTSTSQQIIDRIFSGSFGKGPSYEGPNNYSSAPAIDYSGFQNWVHYSSAEERVINFKYKLQLIEHYETQIGNLGLALGEDSGSLQGNIEKNTRNKNNIIGGFDGFERWAYNDQTSSLFTHFDEYDRPGVNIRSNGGFIGSSGYTLQPFPKYIKNGSYVLHHSTSSFGASWYEGIFSSASLFDSENGDQLRNTIPAHIQEDENNSQYVMFIDMMAHHFDILYSYIKSLSKKPIGEEHPKLGINKHLLYDAAKGMGWTLANGNQASQLWQYTLGKSGSGEYKSTGTLFSKSDEDITTEVWRRIVNNLPYLLKTKGTTRGIKALMNTYGIPQSILSIREYGGPKIEGDAPALIEDRFSYALEFKSGSFNGHQSPQIVFGTRDYETSMTASGTGQQWGFVRPGLNATGNNSDIPPQTIEFRFKPSVKNNMLLTTQFTAGGNTSWPSPDERIRSQIAIEYTSSYSGSADYGRVVFSHGQAQEPDLSGGRPITGSTDWLPLYDGDFWNLRWFWTATGSGDGIYNKDVNLNTTYHIQVQKASDYITGKIIHQASASYTPTNSGHKSGWGVVTGNVAHIFKSLGGTAGIGGSTDQYDVNSYLSHWLIGSAGTPTTAPSCATFSGSMQEFREWLEDIGQESFDYHTLNPTSYVSGLHPTASFDTLVRHYPLGTDLKAVDHSAGEYRVLSSSHPAQHLVDMQRPFDTSIQSRILSGSSFATMSYFPTPSNTKRGNYEPVEETYYIQGISLGGNNPRSQKIRLENNKLIRPLSVNSTSERSSFDYAPIDSNRLGLFYSMADQINKDIFNHVGDVELDDFVGDPSHEFTTSYPDLNQFAYDYWKKYSKQNDINAYIRIFSLYDFSLFSQIKQLLPARTDLSAGLLIEPHALERAKVKIYNQPVKSEPMYTASIQYMDIYANTNPIGESLLSGSILPLSASIEMPYKNIAFSAINIASESGYFQNEYTAYYPGSGSKDEEGNSLSSILVPDNNVFNPTEYRHVSINFPYKVDPTGATAASMPYEVTMSRHILETSPTGSVIYDQRDSVDGDMHQIFHFHSTSGNFSKSTNTARRVVSESLHIYWSQSLIPAGNRFVPIDLQNQRFLGCKITSPGINQQSEIAALQFKPVIEVFEVNANQLVYTQNRRLGNLDVQ